MPNHISHIGRGSDVEKQRLGSPDSLHRVHAALRDGHKIPRLNNPGLLANGEFDLTFDQVQKGDAGIGED